MVKMADYATRVTLLNTSPIFNDPPTSRCNEDILELFQQKIEHFSFYQQGQVDAQSKSKYQSQVVDRLKVVGGEIACILRARYYEHLHGMTDIEKCS